MSSATNTGGDASGTVQFDPSSINLNDESNPNLQRDITCFFSLGENEYNGHTVTYFPVIAARVPRFRIPLYFYLFARYFGAGVIVATAFIHLLDPAYDEIGPAQCVGMTGGWGEYSWVAGLVLTSVVMIFLMELAAERYVEHKYGSQTDVDVQNLISGSGGGGQGLRKQHYHHGAKEDDSESGEGDKSEKQAAMEMAEQAAFRTQIAAFLILEFGVIFHSVIIGLNLGTAGEEFSTLYIVLVFHQSFEGLGIGARLSAIPFPKRWSWLPWALCLAYGLTTPISIAIGLGLRTTYNPASLTAYTVSGVLDSISAGILIYTGLVELLARDFLFDPKRTKDNKRLAFMVCCTLLGIILMALLGKWA